MSDGWTIRHTKTFYRELSRLPAGTRKQAEEIAFGEAIVRDPYLGGRVEKLRGHPRCYKIRIGDYRLGLYVDKTSRAVEFRRALHRRDIYRRFP